MLDALGLTPITAIAMLTAYAAGGMVKGGLGFGLPLVTISITPLFVPIELAIAANAIVLPFVNGEQIRQAGGLKQTVGRFWPLMLPLALLLPLGVWLGTLISTGALTLAVGLAVMLFTVVQATNPRLILPPRLEGPGAVVTGVSAGLLGGLTTINGPIFVLYLVGLGVERRVMLAALGVFFLLTGTILALAFSSVGVIDGPRFLFGLGCVVPAFVGMWLGNRLARRLPQEAFRRAVLAGLFILGGNIALRGLEM